MLIDISNKTYAAAVAAIDECVSKTPKESDINKKMGIALRELRSAYHDALIADVRQAPVEATK
jgi:hypothetical protein